MKRNVRNEKVIRAIAIGLATMMATTSMPVTVLADENDGQIVEQQGETSSSGENGNEGSPIAATPPEPASANPATTVEAAVSDAAGSANAAEAYVGTLRTTEGEGENAVVKEATGQIGVPTQAALDEIALLQNAQNAQANLYNTAGEVGSAGILNADAKPGDDGIGQVKNSENKEKEAEKALGVKVKINEKGEAVVETKKEFDDKVNAPNQKISDAEKAKGTAKNALDGVDEAIQNLYGENGEITVANRKMKTADDDINTANEAIATKSDLDTQTQESLDNIASALLTAVVEDDLDKAISAATTASSGAAQTAGEKLTIVQGELKKAKDAASEAQTHSVDYTYQQMESVAEAAQSAASAAKTAANLANQAVTTAVNNENAAKQAVQDAQDALTKAQTDAAQVLNNYKEKIGEINGIIETANGSISDARKAMKAANDAIDAALKLMEDTENTTVEGAKAKVEAMNEAIRLANEAINDSINEVKDLYKTKAYKDATDRYGWTKQRIDGFEKQIDKLEKAKEDYDKATEAVEKASADRDHAAQTVNNINALVQGIEDLCKEWAEDVDVDIQDLKALLTTGGNYSYKQLKDTADGAQNEVNGQATNLVNTNKSLNGSEEDQNLTADQIVAKYNNAVADNIELDTTISTLSGQIGEKEGIIANYNSNIATVSGEARQAQSDLNNDIVALDKKYVYSYNENTQKYEFETDENGKPVYTEDYKKIVARSQVTKSEYKCGDEVLAPNVTPDYTDTDGSKYIKAQTGTVTESDKPDIELSDKEIGIIGGTGIEYDSEKGKFVQTIGYSYSKDMNTDDNIGKNNKKFSTSFDTKPEDPLAEILPMHLSNVLNAQLTKADITIDKKNYTVTVELDSENATRLGKNQRETYVLYYNMPGVQFKNNKNTGKWDWSCNNIKLLVKEGSSCHGNYAVTTEYDAKKYILETSPTPDALAAKKQLKTIDEEAAVAKGQVDAHRQAKETKAKAYDDLTNAHGQAQFDLYGEGGDAVNPAEGSLLDQKAKAEKTHSDNETIINALGTAVSQYNTALIYKQAADINLKNADEFDPDKADYLTEEEKQKYQTADYANTRIANAKAKANEYWEKANNALTALDESIKNNAGKDAVEQYNITKGKIESVKARLDTVGKKLDALAKFKTDTIAGLNGKTVDKKIMLDDGTEVDLEQLNTRIDNELKKLKKFNPEAYEDLEYVDSEWMDMEEISFDLISGKLAAAINTAAGILEIEQGKLKAIVSNRETAEKRASDAKQLAKDAQDEADKAAKALADWREPEKPGKKDDEPGKKEDDPGKTDPGRGTGTGGSDIDYGSLISELIGGGAGTGEDSGSSSSSSGTTTYTYTTGITTGAGTDVIPLMSLTDIGAGTGAGRTVAGRTAASRSGVLGVRTEDDNAGKDNTVKDDSAKDKKTVVDKAVTETKTENNETKDVAKADTGSAGVTANIKENEVPLNATPFEENTGMNWLWLLAVAAAGAAGAAVYEAHKRKAAAEEEKKYKK